MIEFFGRWTDTSNFKVPTLRLLTTETAFVEQIPVVTVASCLLIALPGIPY